MALTITLDSPSHSVDGHQYRVKGTIDFDASYPTGGEALTAANIGLRVIDDIEFTNFGGFDIKTETALPATTLNVQVFNTAGLTPAGTNSAPTITGSGAAAGAYAQATTIGIAADANDTTLTTGTAARTGITGVQAPTFTGTPIVAGVLVQVANATNLATLTSVRFRAWGV